MKKIFLILITILILIFIGIFAFQKIFKSSDELIDLNNSSIEEQTKNYINIDKTSPTTNQVNDTENTVLTNVYNDIFSSYYNQANKILESMTIEEKVGQLFLVRYPESGVINQIKDYSPGGYILFGRDFKNEIKESILKEITNCQNNSKIEMFFGVDEEGGTVVRVSEFSAFRETPFQSPQALWQEGRLPRILEDSHEKSALLKSIGINMNLAPVADVPTDTSSFIYKRSYGRGAEKTAIYVSELIKTMNEDNMISVMKHFPGYGDNVDTHTGIAIDKRDYSEFENTDFLPFESGIDANGPAILVSHNIVNCMDDNLPASLSERVHNVLRKELGFTGIIMTDDLAMDAVKSYVQDGEAAVQAILAGNDMIISSDFVTQKNEILNAVENGKISEEIINTAVKRIIACKYFYGILK